MLLMDDATSNTHKIWGGGGVPPKTGRHAQTYSCFDTIVLTDYGSSTFEPLTNPFVTDLFVPPTLVVGHDSPTDRFLISPYSTSYDSPFEHGDGGVHPNEIFDKIVSIIFSGSPLPLSSCLELPSPFDPKASVVSTLPSSSKLELPLPTDTGVSTLPMSRHLRLPLPTDLHFSSTPPMMATPPMMVAPPMMVTRAWLAPSSTWPLTSNLELPCRPDISSTWPLTSNLEFPCRPDTTISSTSPLSSALPWPTDTTFNVSNFDFTSDKTTCTSFDFTFDSTAKRTEPVPTNVATDLAAADFAMDKVAPLDTG